MKFSYLFALSLFCLPSFGFAQIFEATGTGETPELAKKDAVANAIKFSVGEFVVSKTELNNEDLTENVIGYSNAYVKKIEVLSQQKTANEEYQVQVAVDIESQKLIGLLKEMQTAKVSNVVDSETLSQAINYFDRNDTNKNSKQNFETLVDELLIQPALEGKQLVKLDIVGKLKPLNPDDRKSSVFQPRKIDPDTFPFELQIKMTPEKEYLSAYKRILEEAKIERSSPNKKMVLERNLSKNGEIKSNKYYIEEVKYNLLAQKIGRQIYRDYDALKVTLIDKQDEVIDEFIFCTDENTCQGNLIYNTKIYEKVSTGSDQKYFGLGINGLSYFLLPRVKDSETLIFSSGSANISVFFDLDKEQIMNLKDIQLSFTNLYSY